MSAHMKIYKFSNTMCIKYKNNSCDFEHVNALESQLKRMQVLALMQQ